MKISTANSQTVAIRGIEIIQDLVNQHTSSVGRCSMCGAFYCPTYCVMHDARLFLRAYAMPTV